MFPMPEAELAAIDRAAQAFRERWASIQSPPWPAAFDFTLTDVHTIDYMEYERIAFPECGTDGAVIICAEVVRRAAQLQWFMSYRGEWILAEAKPRGEVWNPVAAGGSNVHAVATASFSPASGGAFVAPNPDAACAALQALCRRSSSLSLRVEGCSRGVRACGLVVPEMPS